MRLLLLLLVSFPLFAPAAHEPESPSWQTLLKDVVKWTGWELRGAATQSHPVLFCAPLHRSVVLNPDELPAVHAKIQTQGVPFVDVHGKLLWRDEFQTAYPLTASQGKRKLIVITDMNLGDRLAFQVLAEFVSPKDVLLVGATSGNSKRKAVLARRLLDQLGFQSVPVAQGFDGHPPDFQSIAAFNDIQTFRHEGAGLVKKDELAAMRSTPELQFGRHSLEKAIRRLLTENAQQGFRHNIDILLLTTPWDLTEVLRSDSNCAQSIGTVHMTGGWMEKPEPLGKRVTYNWGVAPGASKAYLKMAESARFHSVVYSTHMITPTFKGESLNVDTHPELIEFLRTAAASTPSLNDLLLASRAWYSHKLGSTMRHLRTPDDTFRRTVSEQIIPTDPLVVVSVMNPGFIKNYKRVRIDVNLDDFDPREGFAVEVSDDPKSLIAAVEEVDPIVFETVIKQALAWASYRPQVLRREGTLDFFPSVAASECGKLLP